VLPALVDVGTARLLTHRVQLLALDQRAQRGVLGTHPGAGLDPRRLLLDRGLAVAYLQAQQLPSLGGHGTHANSLRWAASAPAQARGARGTRDGSRIRGWRRHVSEVGGRTVSPRRGLGWRRALSG